MFLLLLFAFITPTLSISFFHNSVYLDDDNVFKLYWAYNTSSDVIFFTLEVQTLGWVGFGFAHKIHKMENYDVIVGKVQHGKGSLTDRYTDGYQKEPPADSSQDYKLTSFYEKDGKTALTFYRKRNTEDKQDIEIKPGPMLLVYAYHSLDYPSPYKTKHEKEGWKEVTLIQVTKQENKTGVIDSVIHVSPSSTSVFTVNASSAIRNQTNPVVRPVTSLSSTLQRHVPVMVVLVFYPFIWFVKL